MLVQQGDLLAHLELVLALIPRVPIMFAELVLLILVQTYLIAHLKPSSSC